MVEFAELGIGRPAECRPSSQDGAAEVRHRGCGSRRTARPAGMTTERAVIRDIGPHPPGNRLVFGQYRYGRVVAVQPLGGRHMMAISSISGLSVALHVPTQSARVEVSSSIPSRA
jgi:hypothetical protein